MKILHLIASLGSGGAERQISLMTPELVKLGLDVGVAFHSRGANFSTLENSGVSMFELKKKNNYDPGIMYEIMSLANKWRPDIIQTWLLQMDIIGGVVSLQKNIPYILSERSAGNSSAGLKGIFRDFVGVRADAIVANSFGGANRWRNKNARGDLYVIRNAVSPAKNLIPENKFNLDNLPLIVAAGRLCDEKNIPTLIKSLALALNNLPKHHAIIFGEGPERLNAEFLIRQSGVSDRIHLGGYSGELNWWLKRADIFISTSLVEGHPNVVIEAASEGCPLVLSDIPAHREIADENSALFAPVKDAVALAGRIIETISNSNDAQRRAQSAKNSVNDLRIDKVALNYYNIYCKTIKDRR